MEILLNTILSVSWFNLAVSFLFLFLGYRLIHALYISPLRHIPGPLLPRLTGKHATMVNLSGKLVKRALQNYDAYGEIYVKEPNGVVISNPSDVRRVLGSHSFPKAHHFMAMDIFDEQNSLSGRDIPFVKMRKGQTGHFLNSAYLGRMEETILEHGIVALKEKWDSQLEQSSSGMIEVNYSDDFALTTFDTIGGLAFGQNFNSLKRGGNSLCHQARDANNYLGIRAIWPMMKHFPLSLLIGNLQAQYDRIMDTSLKSISQRREYLANGGEKPADLLQGFLDTEDPESKIRMNDSQIRAESFIFTLAGADPISLALTWIIHFLMLHPKIHARAVDEVRSTFSADHLVTFAEARKSLPFIEACLYESQRMSPIVATHNPRVTAPSGITLQGHFIPAGTIIHICPHGLSKNKNLWKEPFKFNPDRFLHNEEARRNFFGFSYGVRICTGRALAWMQLLSITSNILKDYDLSIPSDYTHLGPNVLDANGYPKIMDYETYMVTSPTNPGRDCRVCITKRSV